MSSALKCACFSNGQSRIHQGNQIHRFGYPAFEIGTTWAFFYNSSTGDLWSVVLFTHYGDHYGDHCSMECLLAVLRKTSIYSLVQVTKFTSTRSDITCKQSGRLPCCENGRHLCFPASLLSRQTLQTSQ